EVTSLLDVAGWDQLFLTFDTKSFHAPTLGPHTNLYIGGAQTTGVALSVDGHEWHEVYALRGTNITRSYTSAAIDLDDALTTTGLDSADRVFLRFSTFVRNPAEETTNMAGLAL